MKTIALALLFVVLVGEPAFAQAMPNRQAEVEQIAPKYVGLLNGDDVRRREVLGFICADLNGTVPADRSQWGLLFKPGRVVQPADALVWRPTNEHADVLSDTGPMWHYHQNTIKQENPDWQWVPCAGDTAAPPPSPGVVAPPPATLEELKRLPLIQQLIAEMRQQNLVDRTAESLEHARLEAAVKESGMSGGDIGRFLGKYVSAPTVIAVIAWLMNRGDPVEP